MNARIWGIIAAAVSGGCLLIAAISPISASYLSNLVGAALLVPVLWWLSFIGLPAAMRQDPAVWANLFWKEWREHRWKLAALATILLGGFASIWAADFREDTLPVSWFMFMVYTPLATLFVGAGLAAGEQGRGTFGCLQQLPFSLREIAIVKLLVGYATVVFPGILLMGLSWLIVEWGEPQRIEGSDIQLGVLGSGVWWIEISLIILLSSASLLIWIVSLGISQPTELRASAVAVLVVVGAWLIYILVADLVLKNSSALAATNDSQRDLYSTLLMPVGVLPGGPFLIAFSPPHQVSMIARGVAWSLCGGAHAALTWWWVTRYAQGAKSLKRLTIEPLKPSTEKSWLNPPRPTPVRAILWKQARECLPIISGVIALAAGFMTCMMLIESGAPDFQRRVWVVLWTTAMSGFLAALLIGVASFQDDLNSGLSGFWRSRPIDPDRWFWIKYVSGFAVLAIVFGGVYALSWMLDPNESAESSEYAPQALLAFWTVYSSAVCVACLVRNVIYAGILSFAVAAYTTWAALVPYNGEQLPVALQVLILVSVSVGLTLLAWQAMRRDWALRLA